MIIISQDKKCIVNFKNISNIYTHKCCIYEYLDKDVAVALGSYETEERTMEIFNAIWKSYDNKEMRVLIMPEK